MCRAIDTGIIPGTAFHRADIEICCRDLHFKRVKSKTVEEKNLIKVCWSLSCLFPGLGLVIFPQQVSVSPKSVTVGEATFTSPVSKEKVGSLWVLLLLLFLLLSTC